MFGSSLRAAARAVLCVMLATPLAGVAREEDGVALFDRNCAVCHDSGAARIPTRADLRGMTHERILTALETGLMQAQGAQRSPEERAAIADYLAPVSDRQRRGGPQISAASFAIDPAARCTVRPSVIDLRAASWNGWGASSGNPRSANKRDAGLASADVPRLKLKWAFGFPGVTNVDVNPTVVGKWLFVGSGTGRVYALDLDSGCIHWTFDAETGRVRTSPVVEQIGASGAHAVFFADSAYVYSLSAETGALRWKMRMGTPPMSAGRITRVFEGKLFVGIGAGEEGAGGDPKNECCKSSGAVAALDADTGKLLWQTAMVREPVMPTRRNSIGTQLYGPSGASVWTTPTLDEKRRRLYVSTGNSYSDPASATSDAVMALDVDTGDVLWSHQATAGDAYNSGCDIKDKTGCPIANGPDFDFGQPPILISLPKGNRVLAIGQKSGLVYGFDPDDGGRELWRLRLGTGSVLGGINWGSATDGNNVYVAVSDHLDIWERDDKLNPSAGGLAAVRLSDGKQLWRTNVSGCAGPGRGPLCSPSQSAPVTYIPGAVFSGSLDGHLRAYDPATGRVIWDYDTVRDYDAVNRVKARGGSIDSGGVVVAGGIVLSGSGYQRWQSMPGNVLLAFAVDGSK